MSETIGNTPEIATPQTAFLLAKTIQTFGMDLFNNADPKFQEDLRRRGEKWVLLDMGDDYLGNLAEWDGRFFSFKNIDIRPMEPGVSDENALNALIQVDFKPEPRPLAKLPEGTFMTLKFDSVSKEPQDGQVFQRVVALRSEGGPMVEDWVIDRVAPQEDHTWLRIDHWRELLEPEATDLLFDITELKSRLDNYLASHPGPLWPQS